jgi:hypothetical protein
MEQELRRSHHCWMISPEPQPQTRTRAKCAATRNAAAATFFVIVVGTCIFLGIYMHESPPLPPPPPGNVTGFEALRIAHAGGRINGTTYTKRLTKP